jgi:hypothetical protein
VPCQPRPWRVSLTQHAAASVPDLVRRDFTAEQPGTKMVGDIPYIPTGEGWLFLATVIDSCTKEVIGYAMDDHYDHQARACAAFRGRSTAPICAASNLTYFGAAAAVVLGYTQTPHRSYVTNRPPGQAHRAPEGSPVSGSGARIVILTMP